MGSLDDLLGELGREMRAVANYWQIDLGIVVTLNFIYELRKASYLTCRSTLNFQFRTLQRL